MKMINPRQRMILELIDLHPDINFSTIKKSLCCNPNYLVKDIKRLKNSNLIYRTGCRNLYRYHSTFKGYVTLRVIGLRDSYKFFRGLLNSDLLKEANVNE
jgi:predicted transcriptional regulator